jgi:ankyrin repeat protein
MEMEDQFCHLIRNGNLQEIQEFYNNNPSVDIFADDEHDECAFCDACHFGHIEVAKWLLLINPDSNISINNGRAFRHACAEGHLEVAKWLLELKSDIDISAENETTFRFVCCHGHLEVAKWLLEIKPDIDISAENNSAFFGACRYKNEDVALWLSTLDPKYVVVIKDDIILDYYVIKNTLN